jgi:hypothetical protein
MIPGILVPTGNLGALTADQIVVQPIAAVDVAVGDLVKFDLADTSTYTNLTALNDPDNKTNPFNVVIKAVAGSSSTTEKGGIWAVVTQAATAGQRCKVCVSGLVDAKISGTTTAGVTTMIAGAAILEPAPSTASVNSSAPIALAMGTNASGAATIKVLICGFSLFGSGVA